MPPKKVKKAPQQKKPADGEKSVVVKANDAAPAAAQSSSAMPPVAAETVSAAAPVTPPPGAVAETATASSPAAAGTQNAAPKKKGLSAEERAAARSVKVEKDKKKEEKVKTGTAVGTVNITKGFRVPSELLSLIPRESAELYKIVPLTKRDDMLIVGAVDTQNLDARDALNFTTMRQGLQFQMQQITEEQFLDLVSQYGQVDNVMDEALSEWEQSEGVILDIDSNAVIGNDETIQDEAPIIKLVSSILAQAVAREVSDVHIEPRENTSLVRYRLDGLLHHDLKFPSKVHDPLVARIKILSNLRLDERRRPQDGRFSSIIGKNRVDFRVASFPTANGEKIVLRVLDKQKGVKDLGTLGLEEVSYEKVLRAVKRPYGLILATGPTGAGKTTTLYALINIIERETKNIVSLEDPVEYRIDGINQSNIRPEIGYTFATGLRSVLRGDPDQILVGEIRDKETAQLAVQAALTGHVVYSTLHTNSAVGAISRLINFGIDPFLIAPTLSLVIGQRMARRIDGEGKEKPIGQGLLKHLEKKFSDLPQKYKSQIPEFTSFKEAMPSSDSPSGMRGRIGVFETLEVNEEIRSIMLSNPIEAEIYKAARKEGFLTMSEDAVIKGIQGTIPFSEVVKISNEQSLGDADPEYENTAEIPLPEEVVQTETAEESSEN